MPEQDNGGKPQRYVTTNELKSELDKIPTRWEVYTLILGAVFLNQVIPGVEISRATIRAALAVIS